MTSGHRNRLPLADARRLAWVIGFQAETVTIPGLAVVLRVAKPDCDPSAQFTIGADGQIGREAFREWYLRNTWQML